MSKAPLKNRIIKTTVTVGEEMRVFFSSGKTNDDLVYMRQDFSVKAYVNVGASGLHTAQIKLFNLTDKSSREIEDRGAFVTLEAGYEGKTNSIFEGRVSSVTRTKPAISEPDIITTLYCVSGVDSKQKAIFSEPIRFSELSSFLAKLANVMNLSLVMDKGISGSIKDDSVDGDILTTLKKLSSEFSFDYYWTEKNLVVTKPLLTEDSKPAKTYGPLDGLQDIPIVTEMGIDLKVFLDPNINPGDNFSLDSSFLNFNIGGLNFIDRVRGNDAIKTFGRQLNNGRYQGIYKAIEIIHEGSSHDDTWETTIAAQSAVNALNIDQTKRLTVTP